MEVLYTRGKSGLVGTGLAPETHTIRGDQTQGYRGHCLHVPFLECYTVELQTINVGASACMPGILSQVNRVTVPLCRTYANGSTEDDLGVRDAVDVQLQEL